MQKLIFSCMPYFDEQVTQKFGWILSSGSTRRVYNRQKEGQALVSPPKDLSTESQFTKF